MTISYCLGSALKQLSALPATARETAIARLPQDCPHADCTTGMGCQAYVALTLGAATERRRELCEARSYITRGVRTPAEVEEVIALVKSRRGGAAADRMRKDVLQLLQLRQRGM